jgi:hypothetical protein
MKLAPLIVAAALLAGTATLPGAAAAPQDRPPEFVLGVLRADGIVSPFATFDGRRWRSRWPDGVRNIDLPISLDDVPGNWWGVEPPPRAMSIWRDGQRRGAVHLGNPTMTRLMCEPRIALKSDYKPASTPPPPFERPYPKEGLVVSADVPLEPIASVERGSAEWNQAIILMTDEFNRRESEAARAFTSWVHPYDERRRKAVPVTLEALYRSPTEDPEWTAYYVEAVRPYPPGPKDKDGCGLTTFAHGWLMVGPRNQSRVRLSANVAYCDRKGASYMLPWALFRAEDKVYWIYQFSGFEEEWYEVAEPKRGSVTSHVAYRAGFCPGAP